MLTHLTVGVVGEDVDVLLLLMALSPADTNIFHIKPERVKVKTNIFCLRNSKISISQLASPSSIASADAIPPLIYVYYNIFRKQGHLRNIAETFMNVAGEKMFLSAYGADATETNLNHRNFSAFIRPSTKLKTYFFILLPTKGLENQHFFRV